MDKAKIEMPIRAAPYRHQQAAFLFACGLFGLLPEGGGGDDDDLCDLREADRYERFFLCFRFL